MNGYEKKLKNLVNEQLDAVVIPQSLFAFADEVPNMVVDSVVTPKVNKWWSKRIVSGAAAVILLGAFLTSDLGTIVRANFIEKLPFLQVSQREEIALNFPDLIEAAKKDQFTAIGEAVEDNGIRLTITDAMYDGKRVALSYTIETDGVVTENMDAIPGKVHFNGERGSWSSVQDTEKVSEGKYVGITDLYVPDDKLNLNDIELDLSFKKIGPEIEGKWHFKLKLENVNTKK